MCICVPTGKYLWINRQGNKNTSRISKIDRRGYLEYILNKAKSIRYTSAMWREKKLWKQGKNWPAKYRYCTAIAMTTQTQTDRVVAYLPECLVQYLFTCPVHLLLSLSNVSVVTFWATKLCQCVYFCWLFLFVYVLPWQSSVFIDLFVSSHRVGVPCSFRFILQLASYILCNF